MIIGGVAVPLCDDRGHLVSGRRSYRLWAPRHNITLMPCGEPTAPVPIGHRGEGGIELHVEFECFAGTVSAAPAVGAWDAVNALAPAVTGGPEAPPPRVVFPSPVASFYLPDAIEGDVSIGALPPAFRRYNRFALIAAADPVVERYSNSAASVRRDKHPQLGKTGWMEKMGKSSASKWRRRWFVLSSTEGTLAYYRSNRESVSVAVCGCVCV